MDNDNTTQNNSGVSTSVNVTGNDNKIELSSFIQDNSGGLSSTRLLMLTWGLGIFIIWSFGAIMATIHGVPFPTLPPEIITLTLGLTGVKCVQRFGEK